MSTPKIGFIGFGEAADGICRGLIGEGAAGISAFDVRPRPAPGGVQMAENLSALMESADVIFAAASDINGSMPNDLRVSATSSISCARRSPCSAVRPIRWLASLFQSMPG